MSRAESSYHTVEKTKCLDPRTLPEVRAGWGLESQILFESEARLPIAVPTQCPWDYG